MKVDSRFEWLEETFAACALPVLLVHTLLVILTNRFFPYRHEVIETLASDPSSKTLLVMVFSAVIAAPLWEEFAFRLLLQGWLQRVVRQSSLEAAPLEGEDGRLNFPLLPARLSWLPIVGSAIPFASMHLGQGLAPVPLFLLGIVLGYLYRQTQRIVPCIVLHVLFNATAIATAWMALQLGEPLH